MELFSVQKRYVRNPRIRIGRKPGKQFLEVATERLSLGVGNRRSCILEGHSHGAAPTEVGLDGHRQIKWKLGDGGRSWVGSECPPPNFQPGDLQRLGRCIVEREHDTDTTRRSRAAQRQYRFKQIAWNAVMDLCFNGCLMDLFHQLSKRPVRVWASSKQNR